jgi:hypothetical protein
MVSSVREILKVTEEEDLLKLQMQFDQDLEERLEVLNNLLDKNIRTDYADIDGHMTLVESWRARLVRYFSLATAFVEHSKSETFLKEKGKGVTDKSQEAHLRHLSAGFKAHAVLLEGLITCVDSRVNLCKKLVGIEGDGAHYGRRAIQNAG